MCFDQVILNYKIYNEKKEERKKTIDLMSSLADKGLVILEVTCYLTRAHVFFTFSDDYRLFLKISSRCFLAVFCFVYLFIYLFLFFYFGKQNFFPLASIECGVSSYFSFIFFCNGEF